MYTLEFLKDETLLASLACIGTEEAIPAEGEYVQVRQRYDVDRNRIDSGDYSNGFSNNGIVVKNLTCGSFKRLFEQLEEVVGTGNGQITVRVLYKGEPVLDETIGAIAYRKDFCGGPPLETILFRSGEQ